MNLLTLIYEPYVIIIIISIIITISAYFIVKNNKTAEDEENKTNLPLTLFYTFIISFIILIILKYGLSYLNNNNFFQKGGVNISDRITVIDDDVEIELIE